MKTTVKIHDYRPASIFALIIILISAIGVGYVAFTG